MSTFSLTQIATVALRYIGGIIDSGETPSTQQLADALEAYNAWIDSLSNQKLMIPQVTISVESLTAATQSYTIGPAQTWAITPRPIAIEGASLINATGPGNPIQIVTAGEWEVIPDRQAQSYAVKKLFYDRGTPTGMVKVSPVPLGSGLSVELITWVPLTQFADTTTPITIPPAYQLFFELGGARILAPQYDKQVPAGTETNYAAELASITQLNEGLWGSPVTQPEEGPK
jgi:hypothetical protein